MLSHSTPLHHATPRYLRRAAPRTAPWPGSASCSALLPLSRFPYQAGRDPKIWLALLAPDRGWLGLAQGGGTSGCWGRGWPGQG